MRKIIFKSTNKMSKSHKSFVDLLHQIESGSRKWGNKRMALSVPRNKCVLVPNIIIGFQAFLCCSTEFHNLV